MTRRFFWGFTKPGILSVLLLALVIRSAGLYAAPLESGHALAPNDSASPEEKAAASREARLRLLAVAGKYEKTPYRFGGIDRNGLDCSGLVYISFREALGVSIPRNTGSLYYWTEKIQIENIQPGDLLFFKTTNTGSVSHVGIYAGGGRFIHSASEGPVTGVIYSGLSESYWSRTYAGAGRALPESDMNARQLMAGGKTGTTANEKNKGGGPAPGTQTNEAARRPNGSDPSTGKGKPAKQAEKGNFVFGLAAAPTWNSFLATGDIVRGLAGQLRLGAAISPFNQPMLFGLELRPEWDGALGVFRLPLTLSWGINDKIRIFAGPALSFGDAVLAISGENRHYSGGTSWLGTAGITIAPFSLTIVQGELSPYGEIAWQSYFSDSSNANLNADFAAGFRFSTGLRYTRKAR